MTTNHFHSRQFMKYKAILEGDTLTERDILNLKRLLNGYSRTSTTEEERKQLERIMYDHIDDKGGYMLTPEQTEKGIKWLLNEWKTPRGVERKNNPFGYREEEVLEHFAHFMFEGFYDAGTYSQYHNYIPLWGVYSKKYGYFQYYMQAGTGYNGGSVSIIG